jgi:trehalose/maltose hydrolase-like predicted phosphorylase
MLRTPRPPPFSPGEPPARGATERPGRSLEPWDVRYTTWDPGEEPLREALLTLGNGYFATRGAGEEARADGVHYPGTYLAGGYNRAETNIAGHVLENEDLVNWPNWLPIGFRVRGEAWFALGSVDILEYDQRLDLYRGLLHRRVRFRDASGRESLIESERLVHMAEPHAAAICWALTPLDWSGEIEIRAALDGGVVNAGVPRYRALCGAHLEVLATGEAALDAVYLVSRTRQSHVVMAQAHRLRMHDPRDDVSVERYAMQEPGCAAQVLRLRCEAGATVRVEKTVALYTSRDPGISEPLHAACKLIRRLPSFEVLRGSHARAWRHLWNRADLRLEGGNHYPQSVLRLHIFHMLQTASAHSVDRDVGIPARGLHGEAYRGHVFWDELFIFPFLNLRLPELTRALLMYRYRRLGEARCAARDAGFCGAMFPWQSGSDGREESQIVHLNPKSGRWIADATHLQRHVNVAIAYDVWQYYQATGDEEFLSYHGAEMLLEIARFWASVAEYDAGRERYVIRGIVGPDEFHVRYPGAEPPGIDNNAYTNVMAAWCLKTALAAVDRLAPATRAELLETLGLSAEDLAAWDALSRRLYVPFDADGILMQFEGWEQLEELDWAGLEAQHGDIHRLDRILEAAGDDPNRYKAAKQADALMLFYLFSAEEIHGLFERLGYPYDEALIARNVEYYLARTSHGSTLSGVVHAWLLARTDRQRSWHLFQSALASDIDDVQGGTTAEGIHLGAMAGTVDLVQRCYSGIEMRDDVLWFDPRLPEELKQLEFTVRHRGRWLRLRFTQSELRILYEEGGPAPARVGLGHTVHEMDRGEELVLTLPPGRSGDHPS